MANYALTRLERLYAQVQATYGVIPNSTGTATLANADAQRFIKVSMDNDVNVITRQDKTGSRSMTAGQAGRKFGKWSLESSLAPNGTPGVNPDSDDVFQGIFGQASTIGAGTATISAATAAAPIAVTTSAGHGLADRQAVSISGCNNAAANGAWIVSVTDTTHFNLIGSDGTGQTPGTAGTVSKVTVKYGLSDNIIPFALWSFRQPSTIDQRCAHSCVVNSATFNVGQDGAATWSADGEAAWVLSSNQFSVADSFMKAGLTSFPTEPVAPVTNGGIIVGFTGLAVVNNNKVATLRNAGVTIQPGNAAIKDQFGSFLPTGTEGDARKVTTKLSIYEDDSVGFQNMVQVANDKTPVETIYQIGTTVGSIVILHCKGVQLIAPSREEQRRFIANFPDSPASGSSLLAKDEVTMWVV